MYSKIKNLQHFLVTPHKYFIKSERLLWLKGYRKDRLRSTLLLIIEQLQSEPEREFTQRRAYWPTDHNAPTLVLSSNTIMGYCWFYFFPWKHEYISILENKQQKWGGGNAIRQQDLHIFPQSTIKNIDCGIGWRLPSPEHFVLAVLKIAELSWGIDLGSESGQSRVSVSFCI